MRSVRHTLRAPVFAAALALVPLRLDDPKRPQDGPPLPLPTAAGKGDPHVEMKKLFGKIERELREIDRLLSDASAGGGGSAEAAEKSAEAAARMDELLRKSEEHGKSVLAGIDRILELADHPHAPGST